MPSTGTWPGIINIHLIWLLSIMDSARGQYGLTYREPRLECLPDGIRLHIDPVGIFVGHVYVKGHFNGERCHLNYCTKSVREPFAMEVPYRGECNVRRHRTLHPHTVTYEVTVVIQHHPLFITAGDRAYRLNCIYRQADATLTQNINVNDPSPTPIEGLSVPECRYEVLTSINGPILRFANVGEPVVHKWSCNSELHGFVVHSCVVRDPAGVEYKLIDERGCIIEKDLVPDVMYATDLTSAYTTINAFRFADQIVVHFACQITLCRKQEQGCEGIAPPTCRPIDFPPIRAQYRHGTTTAPLKTPTLAILTKPKVITSYTRQQQQQQQQQQRQQQQQQQQRQQQQWTTPSSSTSTTPKRVEPVAHFHGIVTSAPLPTFPSFSTISKDLEVNEVASGENPEFGIEITKVAPSSQQTETALGYRTETLSSVFDVPAGVEIDPMPNPTPAHIFYASNRKPRSHRANPENITVEVEAKEMLIFSSDDSDRIEIPPPAITDSPLIKLCSRAFINQTVFLVAAALMQATSIAVILIQRRLYKRSIEELLLRIPTKEY